MLGVVAGQSRLGRRRMAKDGHVQEIRIQVARGIARFKSRGCDPWDSSSEFSMEVDSPTPHAEYQCPGEAHPISRTVHLGRLASFYHACRSCVHRNDTLGLNRRQVRRVAEVL